MDERRAKVDEDALHEYRNAVCLEHYFRHDSQSRKRKRRIWICSDISARSDREISRVGKGKGTVTPDSSKPYRGNDWKKGFGFGRACLRGLGLR
jgi:hypothetical protein